MNLYEFEGKKIFSKYGIPTPKGVVVRRRDDFGRTYRDLDIKESAVKAQVLAGKRGKNQGVKFSVSENEALEAVRDFFEGGVLNQYVPAVLIEEKADITEEHYLSIAYDTKTRRPVLLYSPLGGIDIESVPKEKIKKIQLDVRKKEIASDIPFAQELWRCFLEEDCRLAEINPLAKIKQGAWIALDAKIALDDDAFYRHEEWAACEPRTVMGRLPTEREMAVKKIDEGENYYRGTAGKYIELDGDIAVLFSGGGASITNMDALFRTGLKPANYTEYSGNPPREKVRELAKIVLSKPGLKGLWICGGAANFTDIAETLGGIADALDEIKPKYPIVVRRAGPNEAEGFRLMAECAERNGLNIRLFGKEISMSRTAEVLASMI